MNNLIFFYRAYFDYHAWVDWDDENDLIYRVPESFEAVIVNKLNFREALKPESKVETVFECVYPLLTDAT